jgi:hypothetical protein
LPCSVCEVFFFPTQSVFLLLVLLVTTETHSSHAHTAFFERGLRSGRCAGCTARLTPQVVASHSVAVSIDLSFPVESPVDFAFTHSSVSECLCFERAGTESVAPPCEDCGQVTRPTTRHSDGDLFVCECACL